MNKKEIQEKLNNLPKPEYLYQRYNGIINKYEIQDNILINVNNANDIIDTDRQALLGKTSKNVIDLIEVGDYVNGCLIVEINKDIFVKGQINLWTNMLLSEGEPFSNEYYKAKILAEDIKSIVTKEQFNQIRFEV